MSKIQYINEIATANNFILEHKDNKKFQHELQEILNKDLPIQARFNENLYLLKKYYPCEPMSLVIGLTYWMEN